MGSSYAARKKRSVSDIGSFSHRGFSQDSFPELSFAGADAKNTNPAAQLTAYFTNTFDAVGRENAKKLAQNSAGQQAAPLGEQSVEGAQAKKPTLEELRKKHDSEEYAHSSGELESGEFADKFSTYAFSGGKLAAAVMAGQGKQMLTFCLAKSIGRPAPQGELQKRLLSQSAVSAAVPDKNAAVRFNRNACSAVGVVADTVKSSGRLLEIIRQVAQGDGDKSNNPLEMNGIDTLKKVLPFMDIKKDEQLLRMYKDRLKQFEGDNSQEGLRTARVLLSAVERQAAVLQKKRQEQRNFLTVLGKITNNVNEAEKLFGSDIAASEIVEQAQQIANGQPPDDQNDKNRPEEQMANAVADFFEEIRGEFDVGTDGAVGAKREPAKAAGETEEQSAK